MKTMILMLTMALALSTLSACGIADHFQAESRMSASQDAYRKCLGENTRQPSLCDPLKGVYERDKVAFEK
jgi:hypothetical protein